jgi:hypothetical protein
MDLGERKNPFTIPILRPALPKMEPLSEARTKLADFFSILLAATSAVPLIGAKQWLADLLGDLCRPLAERWRPIRHGETATRTTLRLVLVAPL